MKKRFLLLTLIMCLLGGVNFLSLKAQDVTIGSGTTESQYFPARLKQAAVDNSNNYSSISQQIYTADEIKAANGGSTPKGKISKIAFKSSTTNITTLDKTVKVYMRNVGIDAITAWDTSDELQNNKVYEGPVSIDENGNMVFNLNPAFNYEDGKNILICVDNNRGESGVAVDEVYFYVVGTTSKQGAYLATGTAAYNYGFDGTWPRFTGRTQKNIITLTFSSGSGEPTAPTAPELVFPTDKATGVVNPNLQFTLSNNTTQYQILLDKNTTPTTVVKPWTEGNGNVSYQTSALEAGSTYYWQVIAKNEADETPSDVYSFTTLALPTAPTLVSPTNGTTVVINNPTLQFTLNNNTTQYQILLDKNGNPTTVVKDWTDGNGEVSYQTSNLEAGATYYWKVIAMNDAGSAASDTYQFTTANIFPVTEYEIKLNGNDITLEWQYADQNADEYQVCFGETEQNIQIWHNPEWISRKTVDGTTLVEDDSFTISNPAFGDKVYFRVNVRKDEETVEGATAFFVVLDEDQEWADSYNNANDVFVRANVRVANNITAKNITIENGGILRTIMNNVVVSANTLVVNEGGQFFATNKNEFFPINTVKFNKKIANPDEWEENNKKGWQFISSPFTDASISSFIPGQDEGDYDLYKYDGSAEKQWVNYKDSELAEPFAQDGIFAQGIGYLASYETKEDVTFTGTINRTNILKIGGDGMMENPGIYLLGNPFLFNMDWEKISASGGGTEGAHGINATSFVVVKADGAYEYKTNGEIKVGEGFFVLTTDAWASFNCTFTAADFDAPSSKSRNAEQSKSLNIIAAGNAGNDNVVVNFAGEGEGFPKLQNFNDDIATVYVQNNDANYGIYNCDENTTEIELCFNANQMGNYTISVEPTGEFSSIVLVDRFTGIETNLLVDDYHFTAMSDANNNRFIVKLAVSDQQSAVSDNFVYQSGEELIIEAEGTVQIIDVMGRVVYNSNVENNRINVSDFNNGTYVVRVINETGVKVEKVVVY